MVLYTTGNGYITTKTLREILAAIDDKLTPEDLDGMIEEIDSDGSGKVDVEGMHICALLHDHALIFVP